MARRGQSYLWALGGGPPRILNVRATAVGGWTPDSKALLFAGGSPPSDIWMQTIDGRPPRPVSNFRFNGISRFALAPDGEQVAVVKQFTISDVVLFSGVH